MHHRHRRPPQPLDMPPAPPLQHPPSQAPTTMSLPKTYPHKSAGPFYPSSPLATPFLRLIPGNPRFATPPLSPLPNTPPLPKTLLLRASLNSSSALIPLPTSHNQFQIPPSYFDFDLHLLQHSHLLFTLHPIHHPLHSPIATLRLQLSHFNPANSLLETPFLSPAGTPVASLTLNYHVITPCPTPLWSPKQYLVPRFVAHRGMGSSGKHAPWRPLENTPVSFLKATLSHHSVNTVELDVQMTSDGSTLVYHDWFFNPSPASTHAHSHHPDKIPLYAITFDQFHAAYRHLNRAVQPDDTVRRWVHDRDDVHPAALDLAARSLSTLAQELPVEVGMMVEVKYPPPNVQHEQCIPFPYRGRLVDAVLADVFGVEKNRGREISFSSFDPDVCVLLALKQNCYPVYFLHCETIDKPCDEFDPRCVDVDEGLRFVCAQGLNGMVLFNELVEIKPGVVRRIREAGKDVLTYGKKNSDTCFVEKQFQLGVNGIIADDVDVLVNSLQAD